MDCFSGGVGEVYGAWRMLGAWTWMCHVFMLRFSELLGCCRCGSTFSFVHYFLDLFV